MIKVKLLFWKKNIVMANSNFEKQNMERVAQDIIAFLKKWGLWDSTQIFTNGKCFGFDEYGSLVIREELHPEEYTRGICYSDCNGQCGWKDYSNPERLLDMTFEGSLSLLLRHGEYEIDIEDVSDEGREFLLADYKADEIETGVDEYMNREFQWVDPDEVDSYEEWERITEYCEGHFDVTEEEIRPAFKSDRNELGNFEFSSREEYEDFLSKLYAVKESKVREYLADEIEDEFYYSDTFFDDGYIANHLINEFNEIFERYGLWYELGFSWTLTTYRQ